jgi:hypothetical protein
LWMFWMRGRGPGFAPHRYLEDWQEVQRCFALSQSMQLAVAGFWTEHLTT